MHYYPPTAADRTAICPMPDCVSRTVPSFQSGPGVRVMDAETFAHPNQLPTPARGDRVARTRAAIIGSALALALAGEVAPIVRDIAKMAGVSARTVFQHFADTAELYVAVLARVLATALGEMPDFSITWTLDERIAMIIHQCSERGERLLPMWTFVETLQRRSAEASDMIAQMYTANRVQLTQWFEHELAAMPAESRERTLNALAMALAPESWVVLRERLGLSVEQARDELGFIARAVLNGGALRA
ncbi:MAG: TetR family transcriptional regulator [Rhodospirillales bacterium]|nr:TetR family transcriptional regulator [Rhodospirillales bacterium]